MSDAPSYDVIVVGVGAMGAATCWSLARRGVRVLGLEQFDIPHTQGSSHGYSRMTRTSYYEHPDYVPLLRRANMLWRELEEDSGEKILHLVGGLYVGKTGEGLVPGALRSARQHGLRHELLDRSELARRYPQFEVPDDWCGMLEPEAGFILPELAISSFVTSALRRGAEIHGHEAVLSWHTETTGVRVVTARQTYRAERIIFTGGAWSSRLVRDLGVELVVTRQVLGWVWPKTPAAFEAGALPVWMVDRLDGTLYYGFPMMTQSPGLKLALHAPMRPTEPDRVDREVSPEDEETFRPCLRRFLPSADGPLLALRTCLYTNSPDGHFILDRHPQHDCVLLAAGFSGHGFKFASVIGDVLADLAQNGVTRQPVEFLGLQRLTGTRPATSVRI